MAERPPVVVRPLVGAEREAYTSHWRVAAVAAALLLLAIVVVGASGAWLSMQGAHRPVDPQARPACAAVRA
jgi:hypothetical protein